MRSRGSSKLANVNGGLCVVSRDGKKGIRKIVNGRLFTKRTKKAKD